MNFYYTMRRHFIHLFEDYFKEFPLDLRVFKSFMTVLEEVATALSMTVFLALILFLKIPLLFFLRLASAFYNLFCIVCGRSYAIISVKVQLEDALSDTKDLSLCVIGYVIRSILSICVLLVSILIFPLRIFTNLYKSLQKDK